MQTILGAGGVIAKNMAFSLANYTPNIRLVSRNPKAVTGNEALFAADLTDARLVHAAVEGSEVAYLTAGIEYTLSAWEKQWPKIMQNVINACQAHQTRLVFFDNVYMYGKVDGWMTEETPYNPCSKKGEIRATIASMLTEEVRKGNLTALIARAADFYGPNTATSMVNAMIFVQLAKRKKARLLISDATRHSLTYSPDAAKATALLGNSPEAYNQTWHLPTDRNALTGKEAVALAARHFGTPPNYVVLKPWMIRLAGFRNRTIRETDEMLYQNEFDYLFDSTKFDRSFGFKKTDYDQGFLKTVRSYQHRL